jgi:hypothetical protein
MKRTFQLGSAAAACAASIAFLGIAGCASNGEVHAVDVGHVHESKDITIADFNAPAVKITNKMLAAPRMQAEIQSLSDALAKSGEGKRPLIKISRIKNDSGLNINLVDYLVDPMEETLTNSNSLDFVSEDPTARDTAAANSLLNANAPAPRLANLTLHGVVTRLRTDDGGVQTNAFTFRIKVTDNATDSVVFTGSEQIAKEQAHGGIGG